MSTTRSSMNPTINKERRVWLPFLDAGWSTSKCPALLQSLQSCALPYAAK